MEEDTELKTVEALEEAQKPEDNTITLSTGVVLRGKQAPPLLLMKILAAFPRPKAPVVYVKNMGREVENPDDPEFQAKVRAWQMESSNATLNALVLLGTELVRKPKKMPGPDDDEWLENYSLLGVPMRTENKQWRYLTWITYMAAPNTEDLNLIQEVVGRLSGIPESKVEAAESFSGSDQTPG